MAKTKGKEIKVTLVRSPFGRLRNHRDCVRGLGLRHVYHMIRVEDTPQMRGLINKVSYLLRVEEN
jgi:large subunit ribosomal protein L30